MTNREAIKKGMADGILGGLLAIMCVLWAAVITAEILHGDLLRAFNELLQAGLVFLVWALSKRMERLAYLNTLLSEPRRTRLTAITKKNKPCYTR